MAEQRKQPREVRPWIRLAGAAIATGLIAAALGGVVALNLWVWGKVF